ncbi:uncharacterized protein L203_106118 [Cryptococcus depauperatus CBS 7841]|uniref:Uncharacterized protein n=1 Tax=Cryptococcus depauperatus CBS 7841 TaxID=1295531 RepID=A0A1E3IVG0_9TREE|nr:hypothetical protein L204_05799 [Cryptococcus depauperatus CBS 7855]ODN92548.1 hypothetical protein L203_00825 [Cryptococcus depauperatus CBS 7841]
MSIKVKPVVSLGLASCCTVFSVFGIVILLALGSFFSRHVEVLTGSTNDPTNPDMVARTCYAAAVIYGIFVAFCGLQMIVHRRYPRGVQL